MKNSKKLILCVFMVMGTFIACKNSDIVSDKTKLTITENDNLSYELTAIYSDYKTQSVHEAVNKSLNPEIIFRANQANLNAKYTLKDGTSFLVKYSKGNLSIKFDKTKNSEASYQKMKRLYSAISDVLAINH
jgi:hypothetical protein